jgi:hypothetical protein
VFAPQVGLVEQGTRVNRKHARDTFEASERQVALAALEPAHVRTVDPDDIGECFLAQPAGFAISPEVAADDALKIPFHRATVTARYLTVYILISSVVCPVGRRYRGRRRRRRSRHGELTPVTVGRRLLPALVIAAGLAVAPPAERAEGAVNSTRYQVPQRPPTNSHNGRDDTLAFAPTTTGAWFIGGGSGVGDDAYLGRVDLASGAASIVPTSYAPSMGHPGSWGALAADGASNAYFLAVVEPYARYQWARMTPDGTQTLLGSGPIDAASFEQAPGVIPRPYSHVITAPDGALWFSSRHTPDGADLVRLDPTTGQSTAYPIAASYPPRLLAAAPDGSIWTLDQPYNPNQPRNQPVTLAHFVSPSGYTAFTLDLPGRVGGGSQGQLVYGPDGRVWIPFHDHTGTESHGGMAAVTQDGTVTLYRHRYGPNFEFIPTEYMPGDVAVGPNGALWSTPAWRLTTDGLAFQCPGSGTGAAGTHLTAGPEGSFWNVGGGYIAHITVDATGCTPYPPPKPIPPSRTETAIPLSVAEARGVRRVLGTFLRSMKLRGNGFRGVVDARRLPASVSPIKLKFAATLAPTAAAVTVIAHGGITAIARGRRVVMRVRLTTAGKRLLRRKARVRATLAAIARSYRKPKAPPITLRRRVTLQRRAG